MDQLKDRVAIITGGAGGIGLAAARLFLAEGAKVLLVDRDEPRLQEAVASIDDPRCKHVQADVTSDDDTQRYVEFARKTFGKVDVLLANAGIEGQVKAIPDYPLAEFERVMAVNVTGVWLALKHAIPVMRASGGGAIVITSSTSGIRGTWGVSPYTASKHAVIGIMRTSALECAAWNIRVNTVNPAPVETRMMRSLEDMRAAASGVATQQEMKAKLTASIPMRRYALADEIAQTMLFLSSDASSYCTGGVYMIDGGISAGSV